LVKFTNEKVFKTGLVVLIQYWQSMPWLCLYTQFGKDRCTQFRVIVVTDWTNTHKQTHRQDRLQCTAPQLARSVITVRYLLL